MTASGLCTEWMNLILGHVFGVGTLVMPENLWFLLCTSVAADGSVTSEATGGSYARKEETNDTDLWNTPGSGAVTNKATITFATSTGSWGGSKASFAIADHATLSSTHIIGYGTLTVPKDITAGDTASFAPGALSISFVATT